MSSSSLLTLQQQEILLLQDTSCANRGDTERWKAATSDLKSTVVMQLKPTARHSHPSLREVLIWKLRRGSHH